MKDQCLIAQDRIYTNFDTTGRKILLSGKFYDAATTIDNLGDKWTLAFVFYILHRFHADQGNAAKSSYYHVMYITEKTKVHNPEKSIPSRFSLGSDL